MCACTIFGIASLQEAISKGHREQQGRGLRLSALYSWSRRLCLCGRCLFFIILRSFILITVTGWQHACCGWLYDMTHTASGSPTPADACVLYVKIAQQGFVICIPEKLRASLSISIHRIVRALLSVYNSLNTTQHQAIYLALRLWRCFLLFFLVTVAGRQHPSICALSAWRGKVIKAR